jgi:hypothetical protein
MLQKEYYRKETNQYFERRLFCHRQQCKVSRKANFKTTKSSLCSLYD